MITFGVRHDGREIASWIENGVLDCLAEDAGLDDLVGAVERIVYDEPGPSPNPDAILSGSARSAEEEDGGTANNPRLTAREVDVALLLREGLSNKDIGRRLRISPATVKNHVHHILGKLRVGRRGEAVALLQRKGGLPSAARGD